MPTRARATARAAWLAAAASALLPPLAAADVTLAPRSLEVVKGKASEQGVGVLRDAELAGTTDDWARYIELYPEAGGFAGVFEFDVPVERTGEALGELVLRVNFRGPERREQAWHWHVRDHRLDRWRRIGDNAGVPDWRWSALTYVLPGEPADHVDALGRVRIRLGTPDPTDVVDLDAVTLDVAASAPDPAAPSVAPPPPPPPPLQTSTPTAGTLADGRDGIWRPAPGTSWQVQFSGELDASHDVVMYDIDLFDTPRATIDALHAEGRIVICYFSAGSREDWRPDAGDFPSRVLGRDLDGWPGERWLDVRALDVLRPIMAARMDLAVAKGCDGVDPDNVDAYANPTGLPLSSGDQLAYNVALSEEAHARGLSIGLKNDLGQIEALEPFFDFAVNESCLVYDECELLKPFVAAGKAVFGIEYASEPASFCGTVNALDFDWIAKRRELGPEREACR